MNRHRFCFNILSAFAIVAALVVAAPCPAGAQGDQKAPGQTDAIPAESASALLSGLGDDQKEGTNADGQTISATPAQNRGGPLGRLLGFLNDESTKSEHRLRRLLNNSANLFPDLRCVHKTL